MVRPELEFVPVRGPSQVLRLDAGVVDEDRDRFLDAGREGFDAVEPARSSGRTRWVPGTPERLDATARPFSSFRTARMMRAPDAANATAVARPMPLVPPVMITVSSVGARPVLVSSMSLM